MTCRLAIPPFISCLGKHSVVDVVLEKLDSILPSALKTGLLDKLQPRKVVPDAHDDTTSNQQAGVLESI